MISALEYIFGAYLTVRPFFLTKMKKIITCIILIIALFMTKAGVVRAQEQEISASGTLKSRVQEDSFDYRIFNLRNFLAKYNSPLTEYAADFVKYADMYDIDYRLVPAISGVESTFGKHIPVNSYNAYGWANGDYRFSSWVDSISHVTMTLRIKYVDRGAPTITKIAKRYAPPSSTWGTKVKFFVGKIDTLPLTFDI